MSAITLEACITPSRSAVKPLAATKASKAKRQPKGDLDLPDYVAPEPKTNMERREWDRMSSRMEGPSPLLVASLSLSAGPATDLPHALTGFHSYCASSSRPSPSCRTHPDPPRVELTRTTPAVRLAFKQLFELSDGSFEKRGLSVRDFMGVAEDFHEHLGFHHGIEERCVDHPPPARAHEVRTRR